MKSNRTFVGVLWLVITLLLMPKELIANEIYVSPQSTEELQKIFQDHNYTSYLSSSYPRVFINNLPQDFASLPDDELSKQLFLMSIAPLALQINEDILRQKRIISYIDYKFSRHNLSLDDENILDDLAKEYEINTKMQGERRYAIILKKLKLKVDVVPPSVLLAMAAINTNWGKAGFLAKSNSLYRELVWYTDEGLKPEDEKEDDSYRIKVYPSLSAAMKDYANKLNSNIDYQEFREARHNLSYRNQVVSGSFLAPYLIFASDLPNFAGLLDYTITFYQLEKLDKSAILSPLGEIHPQNSAIVTKS